MKYLKLYENYAEDGLIKIANYFKKNNSVGKYYNGWLFNIWDKNYSWRNNDPTHLMHVYASPCVVGSGAEKEYVAIRINAPGEIWDEDVHEMPKTGEELKKFFDYYFNIMPKILYMIENKDSVIEFIKLLVEHKGTKRNPLALYNHLKIDDTINGQFITYIVPDKILFGKDSKDRSSTSLEGYSLKKLFVLYEYLKKKFPDMAAGKEWGFFDLERSER